MVRCYECKWFKGGKYSGKCTNPFYPKVIKVDAVDFCDKGEKRERGGG